MRSSESNCPVIKEFVRSITRLLLPLSGSNLYIFLLSQLKSPLPGTYSAVSISRDGSVSEIFISRVLISTVQYSCFDLPFAVTSAIKAGVPSTFMRLWI